MALQRLKENLTFLLQILLPLKRNLVVLLRLLLLIRRCLEGILDTRLLEPEERAEIEQQIAYIEGQLGGEGPGAGPA